MKHYSIMARPYAQSFEVEVCQCDHNPEETAEAVKRRRMPGSSALRRYDHVYVRDNLAAAKEHA